MLGKFTTTMGLVGVDFHAEGVRLLQVREQGETMQVIGAGQFTLAADEASSLPSHGSWRCWDAAALTERLRGAFASGRFTGRRCAVSLPHAAVRTGAVRLPSMPDQELRQAAHWEAAQRFGMDRNDLQVDFIRTGAPAKPGENREEILMVAVPLAVLRNCVEPLLAAGLRPTAVDTDFAALARQFSRRFRREADREQVRAVLQIENEDSTLMILRGDQIALCKSISIGQSQLDQAVAEHLRMDRTAASELRAARLRDDAVGDATRASADPATERATFEAMRPLVGELIKEVTLCLRYYGVTFRGNPPQTMVLCGRGLEPQLEQMCAAACKIPLVHDDPPDTLTQLREEVRQILNRDPGSRGSWAVAAGLSLRGLVRSKPNRRVAEPAGRPEPAAKEAA